MSTSVLESAVSCGCSLESAPPTPAALENRPGLSALSYRVGTHGRFKSSMLSALSALPALQHLTTREEDDLGIALLDGWAAVLDVLTFYQERWAQEGYLRTAVERRSLLELARTIGYELRPGVAARTYLAFTLDGSPGSPAEVVLPAGTRAQSSPGQDELPQPFETRNELLARPEWSALSPRRTRPQTFTDATRLFYLKGVTTGLASGDRALLVVSSEVQVPLTVVEVVPQAELDRTRLRLAKVEGTEPPRTTLPPRVTVQPLVITLEKQRLTGTTLERAVEGTTWTQRQLQAFAKVQRWPLETLEAHLKAIRGEAKPGANRPGPKEPGPSKTESPEPEVRPGLFALRARVGIFGHNAQPWAATPIDWRVSRNSQDPPYPPPGWEGRKITESATGEAHPEGVIFLDRAVKEVLPESWAVLQDRTGEPRAFRVLRADEQSQADFGLSAKVSRLELGADDQALDGFSRRGTSVFVHSEALELAPLPIETDVAGRVLDLAEPDLRLAPGRLVAVSGERSDLQAPAAEIAEIESVLLVDGVTRLIFREDLEHPYRRETVAVNANVVQATHGESRTEVLGSGDASRAFQRFALKKSPLTYTSAPVPSGGVSSLEVRVNGLLWQEAESFHGLEPEDRRYVLRRRDDGVTEVLFGDGKRGARLPSGIENVRAEYRSGVGLPGQVEAGRITLLATRPLGVREVANPVPAENAEDPESRDQARTNAPLTVKTLDRIVSLKDFEDFARAFSGIAKARADRLWDGQRQVVLVTLAAAGGAEVSADLAKDLRLAMDRVRDPSQPLSLASFEALSFAVKARLVIDAAYLPEDVLAAAGKAVGERFSFERQLFGQRVAKSEVLAVLQETEGVVAVDLDAFHLSHLSPGDAPPSVLEALPARRGPGGAGEPRALPAQLLTLDLGIGDLEVMP
ncbi:MAG: putative baseplate assembly protein [Acidobacteria bacterium]|nr:putative baseplate assembly protein [Acidobacteriota bacterium]